MTHGHPTSPVTLMLLRSTSMTIYKKRTPSKVYRRIYTQHHGEIPIDEDGKSYDIHHIDGDHTNNNPSNLVALSMKDHYELHKNQGDFGAARLIAIKMKLSKEEIASVSRDSAKKDNARRLAEGSHHFLGGDIQGQTSRERVKDGSHNFLKRADGTSLSQEVQNKKVKEGTHHFLGINNPKYDHTVYHFKNIATGEEVWLTRNELFKRYGLRRPGIMRIVNDPEATHLKWKRISE